MLGVKIMYKLGLSEIFTCRLDSETFGFLSQYYRMVEWWTDHEKESFLSFSGFRNQFYKSWRNDWKGYNSQHAQTSSLVAYNMVRLSKGQSIGELKRSFAVVSPRIAKIEDEKLVFPTKQSKKAHVQLLPKNPTQKTLLEQAQNQYWQIGQIFLTPDWCAIPFTKYLDLTKEKEDASIQKLRK
ncbi:MAG: hypothetical protein LBH62_04190 [Nitrososphaerota archaeon]|nr:hypothetical protein [Nitrososphaerota archaeon]